MFCCIAEQLIDFCGGQGVFQNAAKHNRDWTAVHKLLKDRLEHDTRPPCEFAQRSRYSQFMARSCHLQRAGVCAPKAVSRLYRDAQVVGLRIAAASSVAQ